MVFLQITASNSRFLALFHEIMRCLIQFYDEWLDFRIPEINSLLKFHGLDWESVLCTEDNAVTSKALDEGVDNPSSLRHFYIVELPSVEVVRAICERSVLVKSIHELWAYGATLDQAIQNTVNLNAEYLAPYLNSEESWAIHVNTFGRTLTMEQKQLCRSNFKFLDFKGPVSVTNATLELWVCMDFHRHCHTNFPTTTSSTTVGPDGTEVTSKTVCLTSTDVPTYFGRMLARGGMKEEVRVYDLKKRLYLGPTSLDDSLALILANISRVQPGMLAYDPFVGTASILIALTHFGAQCTGSDIDPRVLRGEMHAGTTSEDDEDHHHDKHHSSKHTQDQLQVDGLKPQKNIEPTTVSITSSAESVHAAGISSADALPFIPNSIAEATAKKKAKLSGSSSSSTTKRNIFENFKAYGLPLPELVRMDNHLFDRHLNISTRNSCNSANVKNEGYFDVIVTDPPYGIRAGAKKTGKAAPVTYTIPTERRHDHIPSTQRYPVEEVMLDLLHTAARSLVW